MFVICFTYTINKWNTFLNRTILFLLSRAAAVPVFGNVLVSLKYMHASL